jgi:hypothetical protein
MTAQERAKLRTLVANVLASGGCGCCEASDHDEHISALCKVLNMKRHADGSGYDYWRYRSTKKRREATR